MRSAVAAKPAEIEDRIPYEDEEEFEPIHGLPELLPEGEHILWQGKPETAALAKRVFHVRLVGVYFLALAGWEMATGIADGNAGREIIASTSLLGVLGLLACGLLLGLAWAISTTTVYTLTNKRLVIRAGVALSKAINIPFSIVGSAGHKQYRDGSSDLPLMLAGKNRPAYALIWPHVRPFKFTSVQPMIRGINCGESVAPLLASALVAYHGQNMSDQEVADALEAEAVALVAEADGAQLVGAS
ncbi:MAG: photosynthetic complex putative assembly protein PuhB [Pseudomonadota bacterium]